MSDNQGEITGLSVPKAVSQPTAAGAGEIAQTIWTTGQGTSAAQGTGNQLNLFLTGSAQAPMVSPLATETEPGAPVNGPLGVWKLDPRNPGFSGREAELTRLHNQFTTGLAVQALYGMGGIGKSQLAVEYAYRYAADYDIVWWISAEQAGLIGEQYAALGAALGLTAAAADSISAARSVKGQLRTRGRWLLIFDNAESPDDLREWLPGGAGHVIITSRHQRWVQVAVTVEVDVLTRKESIELLTDLHPRLMSREAGELADALGDLPLALVQAAGFLAETAMPPAEYLQALSTQASEVLNEGRPVSYPESLAATIAISTRRLAELDPAALAILQLCAFLAPEPVPFQLLAAIVQAEPEPIGEAIGISALAAVINKPLARARSTGRIIDYGLAKPNSAGIIVHRLTQAVLRDQLSPAVADQLRSRIQAVLAATRPGVPRDPAAWPMWAQLLPQLLAADPANTHNPEVRERARNAVVYLLSRGDAKPAKQLADQLYRSWREVLGPDHADTLGAATELVWANRDLGKIHELRPLVEDTLARQKVTLGEDHPDTLRSASDLGVVFAALGYYERAHQIDEDVLARRTRVLGEDHPDTLMSVDNLAGGLLCLGEYNEARLMSEDVLARRRRILGEDHPDTLVSAMNLAGALTRLGEYERALEMREDVLARQQWVLGEDHPDTLTSLNTIAEVLGRLGKWERALQVCQDALARRRRVLGEDHPSTLISLGGLAACFNGVRKHERARQISEDVLARQRRVLGENHPDTLTSLSNLGRALDGLGEYELARQVFENVLAWRRQVLGDDHPETLSAAGNLAFVVYHLGKPERARQISEDVLARQRRVLGENHPATLRSKVQLVFILLRLGRKLRARPLAEQAFQGLRRVLGKDHPNTQEAKRGLDAVMLALGGKPHTRRGQRPKR
jgi:tetratricopeptide (TPR) repeat protein